MIDGGSSEQELIVSIYRLFIVSVVSIEGGSVGDSLLKSLLCRSTDCRSYRSIRSTGDHESKELIVLVTI